jgi:hypothetical protein
MFFIGCLVEGGVLLILSNCLVFERCPWKLVELEVLLANTVTWADKLSLGSLLFFPIWNLRALSLQLLGLTSLSMGLMVLACNLISCEPAPSYINSQRQTPKLQTSLQELEWILKPGKPFGRKFLIFQRFLAMSSTAWWQSYWRSPLFWKNACARDIVTGLHVSPLIGNKLTPDLDIPVQSLTLWWDTHPSLVCIINFCPPIRGGEQVWLPAGKVSMNNRIGWQISHA